MTVTYIHTNGYQHKQQFDIIKSTIKKSMFRQINPSLEPAENKLREKAIFNSFCFKKLQNLQQIIHKLLREIEKYKKNEQVLAEDLTQAHINLDTLEMLNKTEGALQYDIKQLIQRRNKLEMTVSRLKGELHKIKR